MDEQKKFQDPYLEDVIREIDQSRSLTDQVDRRKVNRPVIEDRRVAGKPAGYFKLPNHLIRDSVGKVSGEVITDPYIMYVELGNWLKMRDPRIETMCVMLLNSQNQKLGIEFVASGTSSGLHVHPRQIFDIALDPKYRAAGIILAHNHPSGNPAPSPYDLESMQAVRTAGEILECRLKDFIIIGAIDFYSHKNSTLEL